MSDEVCIYVLPSEESAPPRAMLFDSDQQESFDAGEGIEGTLAQWSNDSGVWEVSGVPLPAELSQAITEHAKSLGVEW